MERAHMKIKFDLTVRTVEFCSFELQRNDDDKWALTTFVKGDILTKEFNITSLILSKSNGGNGSRISELHSHRRHHHRPIFPHQLPEVSVYLFSVYWKPRPTTPTSPP